MILVNLPFVIIPAGGEWKLGPTSYVLGGAPLYCLDRNHSRLPKPQKAAQSWLSSSDEGVCLCPADDLSSSKVTRTLTMAESQPNVLTLTI